MKRVAIALAACAQPPEPAAPVAAPDPAIGHWVVTQHVLGARADIGESDAMQMHDRAVDITATGYTTPWQGRCDEARHETQTQETASLAAIIGVEIAPLQLPASVDENTFSCTGNDRTPPLKLYVAGDAAMTCWNGACYRLTRRRK